MVQCPGGCRRDVVLRETHAKSAAGSFANLEEFNILDIQGCLVQNLCNRKEFARIVFRIDVHVRKRLQKPFRVARKSFPLWTGPPGTGLAMCSCRRGRFPREAGPCARQTNQALPEYAHRSWTECRSTHRMGKKQCGSYPETLRRPIAERPRRVRFPAPHGS